MGLTKLTGFQGEAEVMGRVCYVQWSGTSLSIDTDDLVHAKSIIDRLATGAVVVPEMATERAFAALVKGVEVAPNLKREFHPVISEVVLGAGAPAAITVLSPTESAPPVIHEAPKAPPAPTPAESQAAVNVLLDQMHPLPVTTELPDDDKLVARLSGLQVREMIEYLHKAHGIPLEGKPLTDILNRVKARVPVLKAARSIQARVESTLPLLTNVEDDIACA